MKKFTLLLGFSALFSANIFAQASSAIDSMYSSYIRPACVSLVVVLILAGGIRNMSDVMKGGEPAKSAVMAWGGLVLFGVVVFAVAEIVRVIIH